MRIVVAMLFSLLFPGAGQAFNGDIKKAIGFALFYLLLPIPLTIMALSGSKWALWANYGVLIAIPIISIADAGGSAYKIGKGEIVTTGGGYKAGFITLVSGIILKIMIGHFLKSMMLNMPVN